MYIEVADICLDISNVAVIMVVMAVGMVKIAKYYCEAVKAEAKKKKH